MISSPHVPQILLSQLGLDTGKQAQQAAQRKAAKARQEASEHRQLNEIARRGGYLALGLGALTLVGGSLLLTRALARASRSDP